MEWKPFPNEKPKITGNYIVSAGVLFGMGTRIVTDAAYYNTDTNQWFKTDTFINEPNQGEDITNSILGWMDDMGAYFGAV